MATTLIILFCYIYIALFLALKQLYMGGGGGPGGPPMCNVHLDDATAAMLLQNAPSYWWRGDKAMKQSVYGDD